MALKSGKSRPPRSKTGALAKKTTVKKSVAKDRGALKRGEFTAPASKTASPKGGGRVPARKNSRGSTKATPVFARSMEDLARELEKLRGKRGQIALVPTMGALHAGHLALVETASNIARHTVVSIFVNPQQFAQNEDLDAYPRDEAMDTKKLAEAGVDLVWSPDESAMYKDGFATRVVPEGAADGLETQFRPHFFAGVATVVLKLFNQVKPDIALFGEKDYQQLCVIRQMVDDLDLAVDIVSVPTVREKDGLALSSRNSYLSEKQRSVAPALHRVLREFTNSVRDHGNTTQLRSDARMRLLSEGFDKVDYIEACDARTLVPIDDCKQREGRALGAAWLGTTRLIDNVAIPRTNK